MVEDKKSGQLAKYSAKADYVRFMVNEYKYKPRTLQSFYGKKSDMLYTIQNSCLNPLNAR